MQAWKVLLKKGDQWVSLAARGRFEKVYTPVVGGVETGDAMFFYAVHKNHFTNHNPNLLAIWEVRLTGAVMQVPDQRILDFATDSEAVMRDNLRYHRESLSKMGLPATPKRLHELWRTGILGATLVGSVHEVGQNLSYALLPHVPLDSVLCDSFEYVQRMVY